MPSCSCMSAVPTAIFDASVRRINSFENSVAWSIGRCDSAIMSFSNAISHSGVQWTLFGACFRVSSVNGSALTSASGSHWNVRPTHYSLGGMESFAFVWLTISHWPLSLNLTWMTNLDHRVFHVENRPVKKSVITPPQWMLNQFYLELPRLDTS